MTTAGIFSGIVLILIGVVGYLYGVNTGHASYTALIPAVFGIMIALLCAVGSAKEDLKMHVMHIAVLFGLLGFILPAGRLLSNYRAFSLSAATLSQLLMAIVCLLFVIGGIQSFFSARKNRIRDSEVP